MIFPSFPSATDGPYMVWLGIAEHDKTLEARFKPLAAQSQKTLFAAGLLRAEPELVILDPTQRARLRRTSDAKK